jgi:hypothetical protein
MVLKNPQRACFTCPRNLCACHLSPKLPDNWNNEPNVFFKKCLEEYGRQVLFDVIEIRNLIVFPLRKKA